MPSRFFEGADYIKSPLIACRSVSSEIGLFMPDIKGLNGPRPPNACPPGSPNLPLMAGALWNTPGIWIIRPRSNLFEPHR